MVVLEEIYNELKEGKVKLYQLEKVILDRVYANQKEKFLEANKEAIGLRLKFLEENKNKKFEDIKKSTIQIADPEKQTTGIEQQIGSSAVPLGVAGPLKILGEHAQGEFYLPVATNEAALVAGLSRGCSAINKSGGIKVVVTDDKMTRAPLVELPDIKKAKELVQEIKKKGELYNKIKEAAEKESRVSKLLDIQPFQLGRHVYLRFCFNTGDAMGMNSVTKYSANGVKALREAFTDTKLIALSGNMCADKKASHINVLLGRGKSVEVEVLLKKDVIKSVFDVNPEELVKLTKLKNYKGTSLAGSFSGYNANVANTIAAMFIATGQDAAQIVESSSAFVDMEMIREDVLLTASFPCLEVATVGGGTGFGTAKECLEILECFGPGNPAGSNSRKLAEIIAAASTAQDLNLLATQVHEYELAESHIRLARGK